MQVLGDEENCIKLLYVFHYSFPSLFVGKTWVVISEKQVLCSFVTSSVVIVVL